MPNWCYNYGTISKTANSVGLIFQQLAKPKDRSKWFGNVLPIPPEMHLGIGSTSGNPAYMSVEWLEENSDFQGDFGHFSPNKYDAKRMDFSPSQEYLQYLTQKFGATNWYGFNLKNYGCKWDVSLDDIHVDGDSIEFYFNSPWGPPLEFFKFLGRQGFDVDLNYEESGVQFCGTLSVIKGNESEEYYEGEDYQVRQLQNGEEINYLFYSIEDFATYEDWSAENDPPENQLLRNAIKEYFTNL